MRMTVNNWMWVGTAGMALGGCLIFLIGGNRTKEEGAQRSLHMFIVLIPVIFFYAMAMGFGVVKLGDGRVFLWARWADWLLSNTLLLLATAMTGLGDISRAKSVVATLLGANIYANLAGFIGAVTPAPWKWGFYVLALGGFFVVYRMLWGPIRRLSKSLPPEKASSYSRNSTIISILWIGYPVLVFLGPDGISLCTAVTATAAITIIDLLTKVGLGTYSTANERRIAIHELQGKPEAAGSPRGPVPVKTRAF
jgi:bacteriorhodopsin